MTKGEDADMYEEGEQDPQEEERQENASGAGLLQGLGSESPSFHICTTKLMSWQYINLGEHLHVQNERCLVYPS